MRKITGLALSLLFLQANAYAAEYVIDGSDAGTHASIHFKANHVGISSMLGRFNDLRGSFTYDANDIGSSSIEVTIDPASIDTNHAARDTHLRTSDYLDVERFPESRFVSTSITEVEEGGVRVTGDFTLHGVTRELIFQAVRTGEGETPFGDYRVGFEGTAVLDLSDYGIRLTPSPRLELVLAIEGIRQ